VSPGFRRLQGPGWPAGTHRYRFAKIDEFRPGRLLGLIDGDTPTAVIVPTELVRRESA